MDAMQERAVSHGKGPALVVAGPGSGKTTVMVERLKRLVEVHRVAPKDIVAISFTKASSKELKHRGLQICNRLKESYFGTFHSFFLHILTQSGRYDYTNVLNGSEKNEILRELIQKELGSAYVADEAIELLSRRMDRRELEASSDVASSQDLFQRVHQAYEAYKEKHHRIDFQDILIQCKVLLEEDGAFLERMRRKYRYICIDEYQDINRVQFEVIRLLLGKECNLFAVGDEDQSIYDFRGSEPEFLTKFQTFFEGASVYLMIGSYRCPQSILELSNRLIQKNEQRTKKQIKSFSMSEGKVTLRVFTSLQEQARSIRMQIAQSHRKPEQCMILYRTNAQALPLMKELSDSNIPFVIKDYAFSLFDHFLYRDMMAYIYLVLRVREGKLDFENVEDRCALHRILNRPTRGLKPLLSKKEGESFSFRERTEEFFRRRAILSALVPELLSVDSDDFDKGLEILWNKVGYRRYLEAYAKVYQIETEELEEVIQTVRSYVPTGSDLKTGMRTLRELESFRKERSEHKKDSGVLLTTVHGAKGLEREEIYLISLNQGIFPHRKSIEQSMEEERRLFYVALTRSCSDVILSYIKESADRSMKKSCFLSEMGF